MKLKELMILLNNLSEQELDQDLFYKSDEYNISGICSFDKAKENLYYDGSDDPCKLFTFTELVDDKGYDWDKIKVMDIEIEKGEYFINI